MSANNRVSVNILADVSHLSADDLEALDALVGVVRLMDDIYLQQQKDGFYPSDLTIEEFQQYVADNPEQKEELESHFTLVRRSGERLRAVSYAVQYEDQLVRARKLLLKAAECVSDDHLCRFLISRADALISNDYTSSDILWVRLDSAPIEATIGPYEEYEDMMLGLKRIFEGVLGIAVPEENERLHMYQSLSVDFDHFLSRRYGHEVSGTVRPMIVVDEIVAGGLMSRGYVAMAYTLPNDEEIRKAVGNKQVFLRNIINAKFNLITSEIARRVATPEVTSVLSSEAYLLHILGHELAHGLGLYCKTGLRDLGHALEEAKADVFGALFLYYLSDHGIFGTEVSHAAIVTAIVDNLRQMRFGDEEAHSFGSRIQYQWLLEYGAIFLDKGVINIDESRIRPGLQSLADEFARIALSQDYERARTFVDRWGGKIKGLDVLIKKIQDVPIDITPVYKV